MTTVVMAWVEYHYIISTFAVLIVVGAISAFVPVKNLFTQPLPEKKILDESPWKDPHEEQ